MKRLSYFEEFHFVFRLVPFRSASHFELVFLLDSRAVLFEAVCQDKTPERKTRTHFLHGRVRVCELKCLSWLVLAQKKHSLMFYFNFKEAEKRAFPQSRVRPQQRIPLFLSNLVKML